MVVQGFQLPSLYYSAAGLRDGIIADLAARGVGREFSRLSREQRGVVEDMARRYAVPVKHVRKVAGLAATLFDSLQPLHNLPVQHGKLLEAAAYLHDTGHYVSDTSHHKHSHYLVTNSDMPAFTDRERQMIAALCRFHRKAMPALGHEAFQSLSTTERKIVILLVPLLRLADSLDRSHEQRVDALECRIEDGNVILRLRSAADTDLEIWAGERAAEIFRQVYSHPLSLEKARR
jgi:exopolyphosphatase/guanosine-5'-triphosphate,3'-diphosphate pyrophosphatase